MFIVACGHQDFVAMLVALLDETSLSPGETNGMPNTMDDPLAAVKDAFTHALADAERYGADIGHHSTASLHDSTCVATSAADHGWRKDNLESDNGMTAIFEVCQGNIVVRALESLKIRQIDGASSQKFGILDL